MSYLKWPNDDDSGSWHSLVKTDDRGWHLRCGRTITTEAAPASPTLPLGEKSCETCLRLTLLDQQPPPSPDSDAVST